MGSLNLAAVTATTPYIKKIQSALEKATGQTVVTQEFRKIKRVAGVSVLPVTFFFSGGATLTLYIRALADVVKAELNEKVIVLSGDFSDDYKPTFDNAVNGVSKLIREAQSKIQDQNKREKVRLPPRRSSVEQKATEVQEQEKMLDEELAKQTAQRDQLLERIESVKQQLGISSISEITEAGQSELGKSISEMVSIATDTNVNIFSQNRLSNESLDVELAIDNSMLWKDIVPKYLGSDHPLSLEEQEKIVEEWISSSELRILKNDLLNSDEIVKKAKEYGLTLPEQIAIRYWSGTGFGGINGVLHQSNPFSKEQILIELKGVSLLRQALDKLPNYTEEVVFSRQHFPQEILESMLNYETYTSEGFLAANVGYDLFAQRKIKLIIQSKTGKHIAWISENSDTEDEVLFKNSTSFKVLNIVDSTIDESIEKGHIWFYLEEDDNE